MGPEDANIEFLVLKYILNVYQRLPFLANDDTQAPEARWHPCGHSFSENQNPLFLIPCKGSYKYIIWSLKCAQFHRYQKCMYVLTM